MFLLVLILINLKGFKESGIGCQDLPKWSLCIWLEPTLSDDSSSNATLKSMPVATLTDNIDEMSMLPH